MVEKEYDLINRCVREVDITDELDCGCHTHSVFGFVIMAGCEDHAE